MGVKRAVLSAGLAGAAVLAVWAGADLWRTPPAPKPRVCAPFDRIAVERLPTRLDSMGDAPEFAALWKTWAEANGADTRAIVGAADTYVRLYTSDGYTGSPQSYEVLAWRTRGGWAMKARARPASDHSDIWPAWRDVPVDRAAARELEQILEDECLWTAPPYLSDELPLPSGKFVSSVDGPITMLEVRAGERRWGGMQVSFRLGRPADLRAGLLAAAFGVPRYVDTDPLASGLFRDPEPGELAGPSAAPKAG